MEKLKLYALTNTIASFEIHNNGIHVLNFQNDELGRTKLEQFCGVKYMEGKNYYPDSIVIFEDNYFSKSMTIPVGYNPTFGSPSESPLEWRSMNISSSELDNRLKLRKKILAIWDMN